MYKYVLVLLLLCLNTTGVFSQSVLTQKNDLQSFQQLLNQPKPQMPSISYPLEHAINPDEYILGPGDVIKIVVDARSDYSFQETVNPEGSIFVSSIGEIHVANKTLSDAKIIISDRLKSRYVAESVNVFLVQVRAFRVSVTGAVQEAGLVTVSAMSRVAEAIALAGGFKSNQPQQVMMQQPMMVGQDQQQMVQQPAEEEIKDETEQDKEEQTASRRNIRIVRKSGETLQVDLLKFYLTGSLDSNPYILDGDVIFVPFEQKTVGRITIQGAVKNEGGFEYVAGETIADLLELAHGLSVEADSSQIEFVRFDSDYKSTIRRVFPLSESFLQTRLLPDDRIYVRSKPQYHNKVGVEIEGEVLYPGNYALENDSRTLRELVERAGGFSKNASLRNAYVLRQSLQEIKDPEFERLQKMRVTEMSELEKEYLKTKFREPKAIVAVDFVALFEYEDNTKDILLKNKDIVIIPSQELTVKVSGQVVRPGLFTYQTGQTLGYYINQSGGYSWNARKGHIRLIRAETGEWAKAKKDTRVQVGDTIFVPEKPERNWWEIGRDLITVAVQLATIYIVVDRYGTN